MKIGFDNEKYLTMQSEHIKQRIGEFGDKLYLEFGGKLFDDYHASRVLPGFAPDSKLRMLLQMADQAEILIAINAADIEKNKVRHDLGITYDEDVLRLIQEFRDKGLYVGSVVITQYSGQSGADQFKTKLEHRDIKVYRHYCIEGYPSNVPLIVSDEGYGKNDYIETERPLVVITVNLAYEAATADLNDVNMIDPYHLEAYGITTVNYNRDVDIFPVLNAIFEGIYGESPYKSPTDMGVNMAGFCIMDDEACCEASKQEIIRRYYHALNRLAKEEGTSDEVYKINLLMNKAKIDSTMRGVIAPCLERAKVSGGPAAAMELNDGTIVTGKTSSLLGASAALLLNAIKVLGDIPHNIHLIAPSAIEPIQTLKTQYMGSKNPRLHTDEVLIALSMSAATDETAKKALAQLPKLRGCQVHTSVMLSDVDIKVFSKLGVQLTSEPVYEHKKLYH